MTFRTAVSVLTLVAVLLVLFFARDELKTAWQLLNTVNLWILSLLIPVQLISYYAVGNMVFDYLKAKGDVQDLNRLQTTRMALELNFVNHALPSGGVSGFSYLTWRLSKYGVSTSRSIMAQVVRFVVTYIAYLILLVISLIFITIDGSVNRFAVLISSVLATSIIFGTFFVTYVIGSRVRLHAFSVSLTKFVNATVRRVTAGRKKAILGQQTTEFFFEDMHKDYVELKHERQLLKRPFWWAMLFNLADIGMFIIAFAALGAYVNPAMVVIAYGIAGVAGFFMVTPGGAGLYEALMISFLASSGAPHGATIAAILLTRTILILGTILTGYVFYQLAISKHGKRPAQR